MAKAAATDKQAKTPAKAATKKTPRGKTGASKAQAIRDAAKEIGGKVRPKSVIAALAAKGIKVSSPQVSATLKAAGYRRTRRRRSAGASTTKPQSASAVGGIALESLLAAKALIARAGSLKAARQALDIVARLR